MFRGFETGGAEIKTRHKNESPTDFVHSSKPRQGKVEIKTGLGPNIVTSLPYHHITILVVLIHIIKIKMIIIIPIIIIAITILLLLYTPYILRAKFFANWHFKTFSRVVKFAIEEESNGRRNQYYSLMCTCTVYCTILALRTQVALPGSHSCVGIGGKFFACC